MNERHGLLTVIASRLDRWREIDYEDPVGDFSVPEIAAAFGEQPQTVLDWVHAGLPYVRAGDWRTGEGFVLRVAWTMEWTALLIHTARALNDGAFLDRLGLRA